MNNSIIRVIMVINIKTLIQDGEAKITQSYLDSLSLCRYVDNDLFDEWKRKALMFV